MLLAFNTVVPWAELNIFLDETERKKKSWNVSILFKEIDTKYAPLNIIDSKIKKTISHHTVYTLHLLQNNYVDVSS